MHFSSILKVSMFAGTVCFGVSATADAQSARDSATYLQAQQMVANGDAAAGRRLADSIATAAPAGSAAYAEGLYWQATLASNARDSEHAYRQIIVDYPLSGRVPDALLRLGQLESARGENAAALQHFQRLVLEHPLSPLHPEASYWVAKMYFDANDAPHACAANADANTSVRASNVELKNRIDFQQQRCRGVTLATNAAPAPVSVPVNKAPSASAQKVTEAPRTIAKSATPESRDTIVKRTPEKRIATHSVAIAPSKAKSVDSGETAVAAPVVTPKTTASTAPVADTASSLPGAGSGVVSRQPTQEEVDRALASSKQASLIKTPKKPATTAAPEVATATVAKTKASTPKAASKLKKSHVTAAPAIEEAGSSSGSYAIQVAAFGAKSPATLLATKLRGRGYNAYVDGSAAPYRVRVGHYATHAAAAAELAKMKARQIDGFVAER
jgi:cell division septation protein DedD